MDITQKICMILIFKQIHRDLSDKARSDKWVVLGSYCLSSEPTAKKPQNNMVTFEIYRDLKKKFNSLSYISKKAIFIEKLINTVEQD